MQEKGKENEKMFKILEIASYATIILLLVLSIVFYFSIPSLIIILISAGLSIPFYLLKTRQLSFSSFPTFLESFNDQFKRKTPNLLQIFLIGWLIVVPIIFIYGISIYGNPPKEHHWIKMEDGTKLSTNVYYSPLKYDFLKEEAKPAPVILIRTPYNKDAMGMDLYADLYLSQGFHVVFQDLRNTYGSEGKKTDLLFASSYKDGVETIKWILDKEWCNGKIGSVGASALSINTFMYAGMEEAYDGKNGL
jgi:hypothetical protein